eukprot:sb/3474973/
MSFSKSFLKTLRLNEKKRNSSDSDHDTDSDPEELSQLSDEEIDSPNVDSETPYSSMLQCFGLKHDLINADLTKIKLTPEEELLIYAIKDNDSLIVIRDLLQQNLELVEDITEKLFPEENEDCPNCGNKEEQ